MNQRIAKIVTIAVAALLALTSVGSVFALYSANATTRTVTISAALPQADACHVLGTFTSWSADSTNAMLYAGGVYRYDDADLAAGDKFKVYNATTDQWINTVDSITPPHSSDGDGNVVMTKEGRYDISYTATDGISVSADTYTYYFPDCPSWTSDGTVVLAWVWGSEDSGSWRDLTTVAANSYSLTLPASYTGCVLFRHWAGTTADTASNSTKAYNNQTNDLDLTQSSTISASSFH